MPTELLHIKRHRKSKLKDKEDRIVELYASGLRVPAIAEIIGCHFNSAFTILHRRGVVVKRGRPAFMVKKGEAA